MCPRTLTLAVIIGMLGAGFAKGQTYTSPYTVTLDPDITTWTSDFSTRTDAIEANWQPQVPPPAAPNDWTDIDSHSFPYGPDLPQLYTSSSSANPSLTSDLRFDRGDPVYNVGINTPPPGVSVTTWEQERLLAAATQLIGTPYQHTHLPQFDPEPSVQNGTYTWNPVTSNVNLQTTQELNGQAPAGAPVVPNPYYATYHLPEAGIDCTDFSAYVYNEALGVQMHSGTANQVTFTNGDTKPEVGNMPMATVLDDKGNIVTPTFFLGPNYGTSAINGPGDAAAMNAIIAQLLPGDLLYMHDDNGIAHVVIWLGDYGSEQDLVISSHDDTPAIFSTPDSNLNAYGLPIIDPNTGDPYDYSDPNNPADLSDILAPPGVQILQFTPDSWFYQNFSLAMQIIPNLNPVPEPSDYGLMVVFALAGLIARRRFFARR